MDVWPRPPDVIGLRREQEELSLFLHRQEQWLGGGTGGAGSGLQPAVVQFRRMSSRHSGMMGSQ